jgi:hypothetical protein
MHTDERPATLEALAVEFESEVPVFQVLFGGAG